MGSQISCLNSTLGPFCLNGPPAPSLQVALNPSLTPISVNARDLDPVLKALYNHSGFPFHPGFFQIPSVSLEIRLFFCLSVMPQFLLFLPLFLPCFLNSNFSNLCHQKSPPCIFMHHLDFKCFWDIVPILRPWGWRQWGTKFPRCAVQPGNLVIKQ